MWIIIDEITLFLNADWSKIVILDIEPTAVIELFINVYFFIKIM